MRMYNKKFKDVFMKIIQHYMVLLLKKKNPNKTAKYFIKRKCVQCIQTFLHFNCSLSGTLLHANH